MCAEVAMVSLQGKRKSLAVSVRRWRFWIRRWLMTFVSSPHSSRLEQIASHSGCLNDRADGKSRRTTWVLIEMITVDECIDLI